MKKKILILIDQPITKYFVKRIELKYLLNTRKVDVYIFNLLFFFNKKIYSYYDANNLKFKFLGANGKKNKVFASTIFTNKGNT